MVNVGVTVAILVILMNVQFEHEVTMKEQEKELAERADRHHAQPDPAPFSV